jgi:hypothetical protein
MGSSHSLSRDTVPLRYVNLCIFLAARLREPRGAADREVHRGGFLQQDSSKHYQGAQVCPRLGLQVIHLYRIIMPNNYR